MHVVITGSGGVLGSAIGETLSREGVDWQPFDGDITDEANVSSFFSGHKFTHLIHAAAVVSLSQAADNPFAAYKTNVVGTASLIRQFLESRPYGHVTYVSTSHVYANGNGALVENSEVGPASVYGRSKLAGEYAAWDSAAKFLNNEICIPRLFSLYSPKQSGDFLYPSLVSKMERVERGEPIEIKGWNNIRDFSTVEQHAAAVCFLALKEARGIYNVGSGKGETIEQFANRVLGAAIQKREETRDQFPTQIVADVSKLASEGFRYD